MLESKTVKIYLNGFSWQGGICNSTCKMFHVTVVTHGFVLYYKTDRLGSLWIGWGQPNLLLFLFHIIAKIAKYLVVYFYHDQNFSKSLCCILEPRSVDIQLMLFRTHNVFCQDHDETLKQQ